MALMKLDEERLARARAAAEVIAPLGSEIERARRIPEAAVVAMRDAGVFKLAVPRDYGGVEADVATMLSVIETIARADGSAGWCAMVGATSGLVAIHIADDAAREIFEPSDVIVCGVTAPLGRATKTPDGYRVTGRWAFGSGCEHSGWRLGGAMVGSEAHCMLFRADQTRVIDTWDTSGLRGTGSHDFDATEALVPFARSFVLGAPPRPYSGACAVPFFGLLASSVAAVAVGIARGALDALLAVAAAKTAMGAKRTIAHREIVQLDVARAEARLRGARTMLLDAAREAEREASLSNRAHLRACAVEATSIAAGVVDIAYNTAGSTSIYTKSPLQRHFRDVHVATQHVMVAPSAAVLAGRVLLGIETDTSLL